MIKNLYSLGLLRNGKVYPSKQLAYQAFEQGTNDGVAKLARYLDTTLGGDPIIRTLVGFYANAEEMTDNGGGQSHYTILDIEGSAGEVEEIKEEVAKINELIGDGISGETLTEAINEINDKIGEGFDEDYTVADALEALAESIKNSENIAIGTDTGFEELHENSVISYKYNTETSVSGSISAIVPMRTDYAYDAAVLEYTAQCVSGLLKALLMID